MTDNADELYATLDGYYDKRNDGSAYFRFIYDRTKSEQRSHLQAERLQIIL